jgi:hypothetical protein
MPHKSKSSQSQLSLLEPRVHTAPCVPAIKQAVNEWRASNYKGVTETTRASCSITGFAPTIACLTVVRSCTLTRKNSRSKRSSEFANVLCAAIVTLKSNGQGRFARLLYFYSGVCYK